MSARSAGLDRIANSALIPRMNEPASIYAAVPGGPKLLDWFGRVPSFHDAEIVRLDLHRRAESRLSLHFWNVRREVDKQGAYILDRHAVVTFVMKELLDLQMSGFSQQNVIFGLTLRHALPPADRRHFYARDPSDNDYEVVLEPCYGLNGLIRCRKLAIKLTPGRPDGAD
jgi:hypothetical protein